MLASLARLRLLRTGLVEETLLLFLLLFLQFFLLLSVLGYLLPLVSSHLRSLHPPPPLRSSSISLYVYSFICWWLIPHYRDRSTDKRNVLGNTQCAPPSTGLSRSFSSWPSTTAGKEDRGETRTRRHQEQRRIFSAQRSQLLFAPFLALRTHTSSLSFVSPRPLSVLPEN